MQELLKEIACKYMESMHFSSENIKNGLETGKEREVREAIFSSLIIDQLLTTTEKSLEDADYEDDEIEEFKEALVGLSSEEIKGVLSLPYELRGVVFNMYKKRIEKGDSTPSRMVKDLNTLAEEHGFTIGYHISNIDLEPQVSTDAKKKEWNIKGYELDDRDGVPMAYYSLDYGNVYRQKSGKYLYLVRAETGERTSHKRDLSNNWGRSTQLSIIEKINIHEFDEKTERAYKEISEK